MLTQFFEHYIKLKTNHNDYEFDNYNQFLEQAQKSLYNSSEFTFEELNIMSESNGCLTFRFFTIFE